MRYMVGFMLALALLTLTVSGSAQVGEAKTPEEPKVDFKLDGASLEVSSGAPHDDIQNLETRVRRAKIALGVSVVPLVVGGLVFGISYSSKKPRVCIFEPCPEEERDSLRVPGAVVLLGGVTWMIVAGTIHSFRRRKLRDLKRAGHAGARRVQWDLEGSGLVF
jgi:hypothetical protein